jgi:hypothetical protein
MGTHSLDESVRIGFVLGANGKARRLLHAGIDEGSQCGALAHVGLVLGLGHQTRHGAPRLERRGLLPEGVDHVVGVLGLVRVLDDKREQLPQLKTLSVLLVCTLLTCQYVE